MKKWEKVLMGSVIILGATDGMLFYLKYIGAEFFSVILLILFFVSTVMVNRDKNKK